MDEGRIGRGSRDNTLGQFVAFRRVRGVRRELIVPDIILLIMVITGSVLVVVVVVEVIIVTIIVIIEELNGVSRVQGIDAGRRGRRTVQHGTYQRPTLML